MDVKDKRNRKKFRDIFYRLRTLESILGLKFDRAQGYVIDSPVIEHIEPVEQVRGLDTIILPR